MATLNFKGKSAVWNHHLSVPYHTLEKDQKKSLKGKNDGENLIIEGDNLLALKALLPQYQGKVKCIYIDPPYNTGNENWVYSDNVSSPTIKEWTGQVVGKDDLTRHDKWLCMMIPRLKILRDLLHDDGVIFVSIGDDEMGNLHVCLNEVFGVESHAATFVWKSRSKPTNAGNAKYRPQKVAEYVFAYTKGSVETKIFKTGSVQERVYPNKDEHGNYRTTTILTSNRGAYRRETMRFEINGYTPTSEQRWKAGFEEIQSLFDTGRIGFNDGVPFRKHYEQDEDEMLYPIYTYMDVDLTGTAESGKAELGQLIGKDHGFDTVKPVGLIKYLVSLATDSDDIVLDSFAGSGTTGQAVLELNKEDKGNRKVILVEMEKYANKITAERVRQAVKKIGLDAGFTYNTLGSAIDVENMLTGKLPSYKEFAKYVYYLATGKNHPDETKIREQDALVGKGENETIYLLYEPSMEALKTLAITLDWAQETQKKDKGRKIVYAPACYLDDETLDQYGIKFVSIPYNLFERAV
jgi:adenine-specific DNA-methyltransferase